MSKFTLTINSHSLSHFQECEHKHLYADLISIVPVKEKDFYERGTLVSKLLRVYYQRKIKGSKLTGLTLNPLSLIGLAQRRLKLEISKAKEFSNIMSQYPIEYKDDSWVPLATERGFSKILYEDDENLFVYEGRPDLLVKVQNDLVVVDHKTQSSKYDYYSFNNQAIGYVWACNAKYFVYNYIKFTKDEWFRRTIQTYSPEQIQMWVDGTVEWCFRFKKAYETGKFLQSWNCMTKWGTCDYTSICEQPKENVKIWIIKSKFKKQNRYHSW